MEYFIVIILVSIFFQYYKNKSSLSSRKAITIQVFIGLILMIICLGNNIINWDFFKEYWGEKTTAYYFAKTIWRTTSIGFIADITLLVLSVHNRRSKKR